MGNENWQSQVRMFLRRRQLRRDAATHALDLVSEVGELAKELLVASDYGQRPSRYGEGLAEEFGDALFSLLALAEACDIDAGEALHAALRKYEDRVARRGKIGSE